MIESKNSTRALAGVIALLFTLVGAGCASMPPQAPEPDESRPTSVNKTLPPAQGAWGAP